MPAASARAWASLAAPTSMVEQSMNSVPWTGCRQQRAAIGSDDVAAGRQHGDHRVRPRNRAGAVVDDGETLRRGAGAGFRQHVMPMDAMAGLVQIERHGQAHVAQPDESNDCHCVLTLLAFSDTVRP